MKRKENCDEERNFIKGDVMKFFDILYIFTISKKFRPNFKVIKKKKIMINKKNENVFSILDDLFYNHKFH